jgi:hypothetical protein
MSIGQGVFVLQGAEVGGFPWESIIALTTLASATAQPCDRVDLLTFDNLERSSTAAEILFNGFTMLCCKKMYTKTRSSMK